MLDKCIYLLSLLALLVGAQAQGCDCNGIQLSGKDVPVCDASGLVYASLCLAECQGAKGIRPCNSGGSDGVATASSHRLPFSAGAVDTAAVLTPADMNRFKDEGYVLAAATKLRSGKAWQPRLAQNAVNSVGTASRHTVASARITRDGRLYLQPRTPDAAPGPAGAQAPGFKPASLKLGAHFVGATLPPGNATSNRRMLVVGRDGRYQWTSRNGAHEYPRTAVGNIASGCSGTLIGPSTVLTAGHCVYDTRSNVRSYYSDLNFIVNRHDGGNHCHRRVNRVCTSFSRQRVVPWNWVSTWFNNAEPPVKCSDGSMRCQTNQDFAWDIALIRLAEPVGDQYGWLGYGYKCSRKRYAVSTAGYPADLDPNQGRMYGHDGTLRPFNGCWGKSDERGVVSSDLDTAGGQSGSGIWDSQHYIRAIHVSGGPGHRTIVKSYFKWIEENVR